ncbi:MAG: hypothetical protein GY711_24160 [bacterium]|nr:hypothetical protein [bacterium]
MNLSSVLPLLTACLLCAPGRAQITSDDCASAGMSMIGPGTHAWDNTNATTGAEGQTEGLCYAFGTFAIDFDVWAVYTATASGCAIVSACNSGGSLTDTKIAAYAGSACPAPGTAIACNDDNCGFFSEISFSITAGQSYLIQLGSFPGAMAGTALIDITEGPSPGPSDLMDLDDCAAAGADVVGPGSYRFSTLAATTGAQGQNEPNCYAFGLNGIDNDIWFTYTATQNACTVIETCNSNQPCLTFNDTKVAVYPAQGCPATGTSIACNDDACESRSVVVFPSVAGQSYLVQLGNFPGSGSGAGIVDISETPCPGASLSNQDDCAGAAVDTIGPGHYGWDNQGATTGTEGQTEANCYLFGTSGIQGDIWALYVVTADGSVTIESCGSAGNSNDDTKMAAYPAAPCGTIDGTSVACNDDTCGLLSQLVFNIQCGESYLLQLGSFPGSGDGTADLFLTEVGAPCSAGPIGFTPMQCDPGNPNSTGISATIRAEGFASAAAMDVTVIAEQVPPGEFGFFFGSRTIGFIANPGGSLGNICVLGNQGRYHMASQIGQGPTFTLQVGDINVPTNPLPGEMIQPGDTWYWQAWYRDIGPTNNFTNVVAVAFN